MIDITNFVVNPVTLAILVMFIVQYVKDLGVQGNGLKAASFVAGALLAFAFKARELWPMAAEYIDIGFFVLTVSIGASGGYSLIKQFVGQAKALPESEGNG